MCTRGAAGRSGPIRLSAQSSRSSRWQDQSPPSPPRSGRRVSRLDATCTGRVWATEFDRGRSHKRVREKWCRRSKMASTEYLAGVGLARPQLWAILGDNGTKCNGGDGRRAGRDELGPKAPNATCGAGASERVTQICSDPSLARPTLWPDVASTLSSDLGLVFPTALWPSVDAGPTHLQDLQRRQREDLRRQRAEAVLCEHQLHEGLCARHSGAARKRLQAVVPWGVPWTGALRWRRAMGGLPLPAQVRDFLGTCFGPTLHGTGWRGGSDNKNATSEGGGSPANPGPDPASPSLEFGARIRARIRLCVTTEYINKRCDAPTLVRIGAL